MKAARYIFIVIVFIVGTHLVKSQNVLLDRTVEDSITIPEKGPNSKKFNHLFVGIHSFIPFNSRGMDLKFPGSFGSEYGYRHKRKLNEFFSCGYSISYHALDFFLQTDSLRTFPLTGDFDRETIRVNALNIELYQRFNFGKRGNYMGIFADFGISGSWNFNNKYITREHIGNFLAKNVESHYTQPGFINYTGYSLIFRAGVNNFMLTIGYRLSDIIDQGQYNEDLEGLSIGIQFGLHK